MTSKEWKDVKFSDIVTFKYGKMPVKNKILEAGGYPIYSGYRYVGYYNEYNIDKNTLVIVARGVGGTGDVKLTKEKCYLTNLSIAVLPRNNNLINIFYLYYYFLLHNLRYLDSGSAQSQITISDLEKLVIKLPPLETQEKIARVLSSLDDKIELNNKINQNLEQQAQAIFNTYISKYSSTKYKVKDVILTANTGADAIQKAPIVDYDTRIRCVRVGDLSNNRNFWQWGFTKVTNDVFEQYQLKKDDIIVTRTATLGLNRLITENLSAVYNNGLIRITVDNNKIFPLLLYRHFQTKDFFNYINRIESETSVRPNMKINYLLDYEFSYLKLTEQNELVKILTALSQIVEINNAENEKLTQLRDALLPKLMNGEIDVDKVEV